jgi:hypothetical protein
MMSIEESHLMRAGFVVLDQHTPLSVVLDRADIPKNHYVVICYSDGRYTAVQKIDLVALDKEMRGAGRQREVREMPLGRLLSCMGLKPATPRDDLIEAKSRAAAVPSQQLVVLDDQGEIWGLLSGEVSRVSFKADTEVVRMLTEMTLVEEGAGLLGGSEKVTKLREAPQRHINVEMAVEIDPRRKRFEPFNADKNPLQLKKRYRLTFNVDIEVRDDALAAAVFEAEGAFAEGEDRIDLTVKLSSDDFVIHGEDEQILKVPRIGQSENVVDFLVEPVREGQGVINAVFLKDKNFIQVMALSFQVGEVKLFAIETAGRPVDAAFAVPRRDINLTILAASEGFQLILSGPVAATATLPITVLQLDQMIAQLRAELLEIIKFKVNGKAIYQTRIDIPEKVNQHASTRLAIQGFRLFQRLFFGPAADEQTRKLGGKLREMAAQDKLKIQIFSKSFTLPWGLLYLAEKRPESSADIEPERFLGLKHVIEHIPLQPDMQVVDPRIIIDDRLKVGLNVNTDIDAEMGKPIVAEQLDYWDQAQQGGQVQVAVRRTTGEVLEAFEDTGATQDQIMYFYCHAVSRSLLEGEGPDASTLLLSDKGRLTLGELYLDAGLEYQLPGAPLVFINACQSAELSPTFYDGFVPYFMAKGARGVIGTECDTPALFAKDWSDRFFERFLKGESLGEIVLDLRREYYFSHNNVLGLLYALYVDGDSCITMP